MKNVHHGRRPVNQSPPNSARLSTYRRQGGTFVLSTSNAARVSLLGRSKAGPCVVVGVRYPWRHFVADLHALADAVEHNTVPGPGDVLNLEAD